MTQLCVIHAKCISWQRGHCFHRFLPINSLWTHAAASPIGWDTDRHHLHPKKKKNDEDEDDIADTLMNT